MRVLLIIIWTASSLLAQSTQAPRKSVPQQGPPPKNLTVRPDGHVSANQDPANADKFEVHVVKQGETLSQIAGEALKNTRMWPQLWEQNEHIINPHWIYPNDKILIRPVTAITEAKPPEPQPEPPAAAPPAAPAAPPVNTTRSPAQAAAPPAPTPAQTPAQGAFVVEKPKPVSEVKFDDLYCSGFVRVASLPTDLKVISKFDAANGVLSAEADYIYLSQGAEDGIVSGSVYQIVRPTKTMTNPYGRTKATRDLGMHYLDIGQLRVVLTQPDFSLARVMHTCADAVEVGDILMPFQQMAVPAPEHGRHFSPTMTTSSGIKGTIISTKGVLINFGSSFMGSREIPGVSGSDRLGLTERGVAADGAIVYIDIGQDQAIKPGDVFIVYRSAEFDSRLYGLPDEVKKLRGTRTAIGELVVVKVGERASTALVTYASDALTLGDVVERR